MGQHRDRDWSPCVLNDDHDSMLCLQHNLINITRVLTVPWGHRDINKELRRCSQPRGTFTYSVSREGMEPCMTTYVPEHTKFL